MELRLLLPKENHLGIRGHTPDNVEQPLLALRSEAARQAVIVPRLPLGNVRRAPEIRRRDIYHPVIRRPHCRGSTYNSRAYRHRRGDPRHRSCGRRRHREAPRCGGGTRGPSRGAAPGAGEQRRVKQLICDRGARRGGGRGRRPAEPGKVQVRGRDVPVTLQGFLLVTDATMTR